MTYDDWKLESPEDEDERENGPARRRAARREWIADNAYYLGKREILNNDISDSEREAN